MKKIVLDNYCKSDFIEYAMTRVLKYQSHNSSIIKYFTKAKALKLYDYFANGKTYCNDVGES